LKRQIVKADTAADYLAVSQFLSEGWVLDPILCPDGKPYRLDFAIVWPLVFYESEEEKPQIMEEKKAGEFDDVESIVSVDIAEADKYLSQGYTLLDHFAKTVTLVKRKPKEAKKL
jgi:hypothetical protein